MADTIDFTNKVISAIKPPPKGVDRLEFKDSKVPGLYLRVSPTGVKSFSLVGRAKGSSKPERESLGRFPAVKPDEARARATELAGKLATGASVAVVRREKKGSMTVEQLWEHYSKFRLSHGKKMVAATEKWNTHLRPQWGKKRLTDITALDVQRWHLALPAKVKAARLERSTTARARREALRKEVAERQAVRRHGPLPKPRPPAKQLDPAKEDEAGWATANRALELLRALFNHALDVKRGYFVGTNPAQGHEKFAEHSRNRFLQGDELRPFFQALAAEPSETMRDFFLVALLTGARRSNVLAMKWADVNLSRGVWEIDRKSTKNGQAQTVTLSPQAAEILRRRFEAKSKSAYVFPSELTVEARKGGDDHIREPRSAWVRILKRAGLENLRIHDLRRSLGSWQAKTGASLVLIGKSLNHKDPQSTAIYAQLDLDPVRASVDRATDAMFQAAGLKGTGEVIPLRRKAA